MAVSIFSISILGLLVVLTQSISDTGYAKKKIAAGYLAQEGIECARNTRDNYVLYSNATGLVWADFIGLDGSDIECPAVDAGFDRELEISQINDNEVEISSTVSWTQGSGDYSVIFSEHLFNWIE